MCFRTYLKVEHRLCVQAMEGVVVFHRVCILHHSVSTGAQNGHHSLSPLDNDNRRHWTFKSNTALRLLAMEGTESITRARTTGKDGNQEADQKVLMSSKPLHRFIKKKPKTLGIVILIFGCAELLMGFNLAGETVQNSASIYIPFWQGVLFLICGNLSIYTEVHPSKKMVTVCLAMYVVSILGIIISVCYRIYCFFYLSYFWRRRYWSGEDDPMWSTYRINQLFGIEGILAISSVCVSVLLIFLCAVARLALKSTRTQVIVQLLPPPQSDATSS